MIGSSRGGMMTYMACRNNDDIKAAVIYSGVSDAISNYNDREQKMKNVYLSLVGGTPEQLEDEYIKRSAVYWADEIDVPLYIFHGGEKDWRVDVTQAIDMAEKLKEYDKEYNIKIFEDEAHSYSVEAWQIINHETLDWFNSHK